MRLRVLLTIALSVALLSTSADAQWWRWGRPKQSTPVVESGDLASLPLLHQADIDYLGGFRVDNLERIGRALGYDPTTNTLFAGGRQETGDVAEISIPTLVTSATYSALNPTSILQAMTDVTEGTLAEVFASTGFLRIGNGMVVNGTTLYFTAFSFYDGSNETRVSHAKHSRTLATPSFEGWEALYDNTLTAHTSGWCTDVPTVAQAAFGGPHMCGGGTGWSVISRLPWGFSAYATNLSAISGRTPQTMTGYRLMDFFQANPVIDQVANNPNGMWNATTTVGGFAMINGTRTLLVFGTHGGFTTPGIPSGGPHTYGERCYGNGTNTAALHGTPYNASYPYCYDPWAVDVQGEHGYPYRFQIWLFDAAQMAEIKAGTRTYYNIQPYEYFAWDPLISDGGFREVGGVTYDSVHNKLYVAQMRGSYSTIVHAFGFTP